MENFKLLEHYIRVLLRLQSKLFQNKIKIILDNAILIVYTIIIYNNTVIYKTGEITMKKIINGKMCNTETAQHIDSNSSSGLSQSDFRYFNEQLYRTKTGVFFLYGEGGSLSEYAEDCVGGGWDYGVKIILLSLTDARKWVENYSSTEVYTQLFGECTE